MITSRGKVDRNGRVLIPANLRRELGLEAGEAVILEVKDGELHPRPYRQAIEEARAIIRQYIPDRTRSLVDELIEQRRTEAARERGRPRRLGAARPRRSALTIAVSYPIY